MRRSGRKEGWRQIAGDYSSTLSDLVPFFNRPAWIRRLRYKLLIHVSRSHPQLARSPSHTVVCTVQNRADKTFKSAGLYLQDCICITIVYLCLKGLWRIAFLITEHKRKSLQSEMYYFFKDFSGVTTGLLNPPPNSIQSFSSRFAKVLKVWICYPLRAILKTVPHLNHPICPKMLFNHPMAISLFLWSKLRHVFL